MTVELRDLWRRFSRNGDQGARERLVLAYAPVVKVVAGKMASALPAHIDEADLVSYGLVGLVKAIDRFDPDREVKFETYAITRIKGAIIDELRTQDWVPRSVRIRARAIERANAKLEHLMQRAPTDEELAAELELTVPELRETLAALSQSTFVALDALLPVSDGGDQGSLLSALPDHRAPDPIRAMDMSHLKDRIGEALGCLPDRERLILALYYYESFNLREIGEIIGVSESRVSQLHTKAVLRMRGRLAHDYSLMEACAA